MYSAYKKIREERKGSREYMRMAALAKKRKNKQAYMRMANDEARHAKMLLKIVKVRGHYRR